MKRTSKSAEIAELEITLVGTDPPIWRRFAIRSNASLAELHVVIQVVMGWEDYHLHQFIGKNKTCYGPPELELDVIDESCAIVRDLVQRKGSRFQYEYDFGDGWLHDVKLVKFAAPDPQTTYPVCLDGARACPPEDSGGVYRYALMLDALADPDHDEREDIMEWLGDDFDALKFDLEQVNRALKAL